MAKPKLSDKVGGSLIATPTAIVRLGWRDAPYRGDDVCEGCGGWGCKSTTLRPSSALVHRTCPACKGTGREQNDPR